MHLKRSKVPMTWPIPRKGGAFVSKPSHAKSRGISVLVVLRDILKIVRNRHEARYMCLNGMVKVNNKVRYDEDFPLQVFDTLNLEKAKMNYRLEIVNRRFSLKEISGKEAETKIVKISGKTIRGKELVQMNLDDGSNFLTKEKFSVGDSAVINTKLNKVEKVLALKKGAKVEIVLGKHAGKKGDLMGFEELSRGKNFVIKLEDKEVKLPFKTVLVIG